MRQIELQTGAFRPGTTQPESHAILLRLLETLIELDRDHLRRHPRTPPLYRAGVRYRREPRVAELRETGVPARPCFRSRKHGKRRVYHIMVCLPDGAVEDPSRVLGMGWAEK